MLTKLKIFCKVNGYTLHSDVNLDNDGEDVHFDYVMTGAFGVTVLNENNLLGDVYGTAIEERWVAINNDKKTAFKNPVESTKKDVLTLKKMLSKNGVNSSHVDFFVVFLKDSVLNVPKTLPLAQGNTLHKKLDKIQYLDDHGYNTADINAVIEKYSK